MSPPHRTPPELGDTTTRCQQTDSEIFELYDSPKSVRNQFAAGVGIGGLVAMIPSIVAGLITLGIAIVIWLIPVRKPKLLLMATAGQIEITTCIKGRPDKHEAIPWEKVVAARIENIRYGPFLVLEIAASDHGSRVKREVNGVSWSKATQALEEINRRRGIEDRRERARFWDGGVIFTIALATCLLVIPLVISYLNYNVPEKGELIALMGRAITVNNDAPHILLESDAGEQVYLSLPNIVGPLGGSHPYFKVVERRAVLSCGHLTAQGNYLQFHWPRRFRVWELKCDNGFAIEYPALRKEWEDNRAGFHLIGIAGVVFAFTLFFVIFYIRFRRENK